MIEFVTWLSVAVLGPGSVAVFIWFLLSLRGIAREQNRGEDA
jgi:hypothetical protein